MRSAPTVSLRRTVQQVKHCVQEALDVIEHGEDMGCALDDLEQAKALIVVCLKRILDGEQQLQEEAR